MIKIFVKNQNIKTSLFGASVYGFTKMDKYPNDRHTVRKPEEKIFDDSTLQQIKQSIGL